MKHIVEVAHIINGDLVSVRRLSLRRERLGGLWAAAIVAGLSLAAMAAVVIGVRTLGRSIYVPLFAAVWFVTAGAVAAVAVTLVRRRLRKFVLGSSLRADAYSAVDVDLVRRVGDRFELTIAPGIEGVIENGRSPLPLETFVASTAGVIDSGDGRGHRTIVLDEGAEARLSVGPSMFVVRSRPGTPPREAWVSRELFGLFSRVAVLGVQVALVASLFAVVPSGKTIGDRAAHLVSPRITTPWEAEKWLRIEAQAQARSLHQCFDPLPLACQHPGYVGVGVSLSRDGEVRSNWIARSTYQGECVVDACVQNVVSTWIFDPLPEAMRVILPVQVLRTDKPLPPKVAEVGGDGRGAAPARHRSHLVGRTVDGRWFD